MGDPIISSTPPVQPVNTTVPVAPQPKKSGGFRQVLGGIVGGVLNIVAPGVGSAIGGIIGGGGNSGASAANYETMMNNNMEKSMQLLSVQNRLQSQSQEFTTFSNLLKAKHDSEMSVVSNFKS